MPVVLFLLGTPIAFAQGPGGPFGGPNNPTGIPGQAPFSPALPAPGINAPAPGFQQPVNPALSPFTKPLINNGWASQGGNWGPGMNMPPAPIPTPVIASHGRMRVIACGYDITGVWRVLPMVVHYRYNGIQYMVNVLSAWNPITRMWIPDVDTQAFNTTYTLRGVTYNYYTVLSFGTFYFNI